MRILVTNDGGIDPSRFVLDSALIQTGETIDLVARDGPIDPRHFALAHDRALTALESLYQ